MVLLLDGVLPISDTPMVQFDSTDTSKSTSEPGGTIRSPSDKFTCKPSLVTDNEIFSSY